MMVTIITMKDWFKSSQRTIITMSAHISVYKLLEFYRNWFYDEPLIENYPNSLLGGIGMLKLK